jgi:hypothetical protein
LSARGSKLSQNGETTVAAVDAAQKSYSRDNGFPVTVRSGGAETITIARDSTGQL